MNVNVFLKIGKEVSEQAQAMITREFVSNNLEINQDKPTSDDKIGFIIRHNVADLSRFTKNVYRTLQHIPRLYLVAPQKALDKVKHHPGVHCFDSQLLEDPSAGASTLINYAYYGRPL